MQKDKRLRKGTEGLYKKKFKQIRTQKPILSLTSQALRVTDERGKGKDMKKAERSRNVSHFLTFPSPGACIRIFEGET